MGASSTPWIFVGIIFLEVVFILSIASPDFVKEARIQEHKSAIHLMGEKHAGEAVGFASDKFGEHFVNTDLVAGISAALVPTDENKAKATGLEEFVPDLFGWASARLEGFWGMIFGAYHRVYVMAAVGVVCIPMVVVALIDGLVARKVSITLNDVGKPVFFHGAKRAAAAMVLMPLMLLLYPATINQSIWWGWLLVLPAVLWVQTANVQEL